VFGKLDISLIALTVRGLMELQSSVVAILNNKNKIIGTGFVAGENLILTCPQDSAGQ
jgi:hypothetical protein